MEENPVSVSELFEKTEHYVKNSLELFKLKAVDGLANVASSFVSRIIVILFVAMFFFSFNIGVSLWLGQILGNSYNGFFVVSGFYLILGLIFYLFRNRWIKTPVSNSIISQALK